jgi:hypothetical protein
MRRSLPLRLALLPLALLATRLPAQHPFAQGGSYDPAVPTPRAVLGYDVGERFTPHHLLMRYIERVAATSRRVRVDTLDVTAEGRPIVAVLIAGERYRSRLDDVKRDAARLADPRTLSPAELDATIARMPAIVWLGYTIHGGEASGTEAAIAGIYQLAAGTDAETRRLLDSVVVIVDPVQNPDGHERHAQDVMRARGVRGVPVHPSALIHSGNWPGPRTSHYQFDLNRDWFIQSHPESRARASTIGSWWPHVAADLHEMGSNSTYYFAPPMEPVNKNVPQNIRDWWDVMASGISAAFDQFGWSYFRREGYDEFYPGYGISYPILTGAVGMTFEQASSSGGAIRRRDGTILTLSEAASHHYVAAWATLQVTAARRTQRLRDYVAFRRSAATLPGGVVFDRDPHGRADSLVATLLRNQIEVRRVAGPITLTGATPYFEAPRPSVTLATAYVVSYGQPNGRLAKALLEAEATLDSSFIAEELESRRTGAPSRFYDITGWSLPLAHRVRAFQTNTPPSGGETVTVNALAARSSVPLGRGAYGYAFAPGGAAATRLLSQLLAVEAKVWWAPKAFASGGVRFSQGAFVVRSAANADSVHTLIARVATEYGATVVPLARALVDEGTDLGSNSVIPVIPPRVAMLGGAPVGGNSFGFAWYQFDHRMGYPVTSIGVDGVTGGALAQFDVLVIPSTSAGALDRAFGDAGRERLAAWVRGGGVLITVENATQWVASERVGLSRLRVRRDSARADGTAPLPVDIPGAILRAQSDTLSPLLAGLREEEIPVQLDGERFLVAPRDRRPGEMVLRYAPAARVRVSGYLWPEAADRLAGTPYLWTETVGSGRVIAFAGDPNFRALWRGLEGLFANAVLLAKSF